MNKEKIYCEVKLGNYTESFTIDEDLDKEYPGMLNHVKKNKHKVCSEMMDGVWGALLKSYYKPDEYNNKNVKSLYSK